MAEAVALRAAFIRLGFTPAAAGEITDQQGIDTRDELKILTDSEIENLCRVIRKPGGTVNLNGNNVPDPGVSVSLRAENNLKLACFYLRHQDRIHRDSVTNNITLVTVRALRALREHESNYDNPSEPPTIDDKNWPKTMEAIREYLASSLGSSSKLPLAYIIRDDMIVPAAAGDPATNYDTNEEEMIARAPHTTNNLENGDKTDHYIEDNTEVWSTLERVCRDHTCWTYIKGRSRRRDGRGAYQDLWNQFLGPNNVDNMANAAEAKLTTTVYHGEKKRWNFERYVRTHVEQYTILDGLVQYGHSGIDQRSRVRHLNAGIKTNALDVPKAQIIASATLRNDFDASVSLYKDFIKQNLSQQASGTLNVSSIRTNRNGPRSGGARSSNNNVQEEHVDDRYYTSQEYQDLRPGQKKRLKRIRDERGHSPQKRQKLASNVSSAQMQKVTQTVAALAATVSKLAVGTKTATDDSNMDSDDDNGNRSHPALTRQKKKSKK